MGASLNTHVVFHLVAPKLSSTATHRVESLGCTIRILADVALSASTYRLRSRSAEADVAEDEGDVGGLGSGTGVADVADHLH